MTTLSLHQTKQWLKTSNSPVAKFLFFKLKSLRTMEMPCPRIMQVTFYTLYKNTHSIFSELIRVVWWTPLFKGRLKDFGKNTYLYGGLPFISGPVEIKLGNNCRVSGYTTFSGRSCSKQTPTLTIGNNVDIGWMTTIAVGQCVDIGNNVRIAGRTLLAGYPGHPINIEDRAAGLPETDDQVADIIIEDDVWLATNVSIVAGVRIGRGTIVATGSVVTHDLPPMVLAGGIPARVIRHLDESEKNKLVHTKKDQE